MLRKIIDEGAYDKLTDFEQRQYTYCCKCKFYYLSVHKRSHLCGVYYET